MGKQNRTILKSFFQQGDIPTEGQYVDLIDSNLNLSENNTGDVQLTGNITASGNISSSGNIITSGNISAIGNISASGDLIGDKLVIDNFTSINVNSSNGRLFEDGSISAIEIGRSNEPTKNISLFGPVTASGNISASGFIKTDSNITASGNISSSGRLTANGLTLDDNTHFFGGKRFTISGGIGGTYEFRDGSINVPTGDITASGDISASGDLLSDNLTVAAITNTSRLVVDQIDEKDPGNGIIINNNITASQNISASGKLIASTLNTGQGDNELYDMDQNVKTTSTVTFSSISIPTIDLSSVRTNGFPADFNVGSIDIGSAFGGVITMINVPSTSAKTPLQNFLVTAARCQSYTIIVANSNARSILVSPNTVGTGQFRLDLSTGAEGFSGGTIKINFQMLGV